MQLKREHGGFTLIELLVVIAIIGILSTIVLVNVNSARNKAKNAAIKGSLEQARVAAELYYDDQSPTSYSGFCTSSAWTRISNAISDQGGTATCEESADNSAWCAQSTLVGTSDKYCVDSTGYAGTDNVSCDSTNGDCASP